MWSDRIAATPWNEINRRAITYVILASFILITVYQLYHTLSRDFVDVLPLITNVSAADKIALISIYEHPDGIIPWFGRVFVDTIRHQPNVVWLLVVIHNLANPVTFDCTDGDVHWSIPDNVNIIEYTVAEFDQVLVDRINATAGVFRGYKLFELKPMYGEVLVDYLPAHVYKYFGWTDFDMALGQVGEMVKYNTDVVAAYYREGWQSPTLPGQMTLFANNNRMRQLWRQSAWAQHVISHKKGITFDEEKFANIVFDPKYHVTTTILTDGGLCDLALQTGQSGDDRHYQYTNHSLKGVTRDGQTEYGYWFHFQFSKYEKYKFHLPVCLELHSTFGIGSSTYMEWCVDGAGVRQVHFGVQPFNCTLIGQQQWQQDTSNIRRGML